MLEIKKYKRKPAAMVYGFPQQLAMDALTLQKLAQWEQAHVNGNKKPLTTRDYPPMRSCQDITLKDIHPIHLIQKKARIEALLAKEKETSDKITTPSNTTSSDSTPSSKTLLSRKAYYESWDKFDVDKALEDFEKDEKRASTKPPIPIQNPAKTASKPALVKSPLVTATADHVKLSTKPTDPVAAANSEKEKGNEYFKKKEYAKAIEHYSASITLDPSNPILPINRAMALLKLERFAEAESDCTLGLKLDKNNVKALWRRGIARQALGNVNEAKKDFELALKIDPTNKAVKEELKKLELNSLPTTATINSSTAKPLTTVSTTSPKAPPSNNQESAPIVATTSSESTKKPVISSKRVLIKEVEDDENSELFSNAIPKKHVTVDSKSSTATTANNTLSGSNSEHGATDTTKSAPSTTPSSNPSLATLSTTTINNIQTNMIAPTTTLDFQRDWKSYSKNSEQLYQYIKLIQPEAYSGLFKSAFESDYFSSMLTIFKNFYISSEDPQLLYRCLLNLCKVQRFDMTLMFMSGTDKKDLVSIFKHLASHVSDGTTAYSQKDLTALASRFKITSY
ncbi:hypothetical protein FBU30_003010 [Linnemannia zychae]|nr:hypothetical protein FBU30_003010 [Linnemannia zychae]